MWSVCSAFSLESGSNLVERSSCRRFNSCTTTRGGASPRLKQQAIERVIIGRARTTRGHASETIAVLLSRSFFAQFFDGLESSQTALDLSCILDCTWQQHCTFLSTFSLLVPSPPIRPSIRVARAVRRRLGRDKGRAEFRVPRSHKALDQRDGRLGHDRRSRL